MAEHGSKPLQIKLQKQIGDPYTDYNKQLKGVVAFLAKWGRPIVLNSLLAHKYNNNNINAHNIEHMDPLLDPLCSLEHVSVCVHFFTQSSLSRTSW